MLQTHLKQERQIIKALRQAREQQGISQQKLSEKVLMSAGYISQVERGVRHPTLLTLIRWADALNISLGQLICQTEK